MEYIKFIFLLYVLSVQIRQSTQSCDTQELETEPDNDCLRRRYGYSSRLCYPIVAAYSVTCSEEAMESIRTTGISSKMKTITINNTTSLTIVSSAFDVYSNLIQLTINYGSIENIHPGAFNGLTKLEQLKLTYQNVTTLSKGVFNSLTAVKTLDLSSNSIGVIEKQAFLGMASLKELFLSNNNIDDITELENVCGKMEVLDLSHNEISNLISFKNFSNLRVLILNNNKIMHLSGDMFAHTHITKLNISHNFIESIDSNTFAGMVPLEDLNLAFNNLRQVQGGTLPVGIFRDNKSLKYLNISSTGVSTLRIGIFTGLEQMLRLDLSFNQLTYLPKGLFHDLKQLIDLYLDHNKLTYFEYDGFGQLKRISLNSNSWNCDTLSNITTILRETEIIRGTTYNSTNVYGIGCLEKLVSADKNHTQENSTYSVQPATNDEPLSQTIVDLYQNFFEDVRKDLKALYEEFSGNFLISFKEMCSVSHGTLRVSKHDEGHDVNEKPTRATLDNLNAQEKTEMEGEIPINAAERINSGIPSAQTYDDSTSSTVLVCILIVLIVMLFVLIFMVYLLIQIKSINQFRKVQVPLLENVRL